MFTMMGDGSINNSSYTGIKFRVAGASAGDYTKAGIFVVRQGGYNDLDMLFCFNKDANATGVSDGDAKVRITSDGNVGIGTAINLNGSMLSVYGADVGEGTARGQIVIKDTAAYDASPTAGIVFQRIHAAGSQAIFAGIRGFKENATNGNYAGALAFDVRANGAVAYEALRIDSAGQVLPGADDAQNLGSSTKRWKNIYAADMHYSNEGGENSVDGTWGSYTIQEGESDLYLLNNRNGKKYKFVLQEVS